MKYKGEIMLYKEEFKNLFSVSKDYYLVQCISADFVMGKGIALEFNKRFNIKNILKNKYPNYLISFVESGKIGDCILEQNVLNLITKERYWNKPTYKSLSIALDQMKNLIKEKQIQKIAMPLIGCGLDKLNWNVVSEIIQTKFINLDIEILVCIKI